MQEVFSCREKEGRFVALVRREIIQKPKWVGGLGLDDLMLKNAALLLKWWGRFMTEEGIFCRKVIISIHEEEHTLIPLATLARVLGP